MSWAQYGRFIFIGALVGLLTVAVRELIGAILPGDSPVSYSVSILIAYSLGILSSFELNRRFTFRSSTASRQRDGLPLFILCALVGMGCTWLLTLLIRYGLSLDAVIGRAARTVAFAIATLLASFVNYFLSARFVFRRRSVVRGSDITDAA